MMANRYEIQMTDGGITIWLRNGIQTFTEREALKLVQVILDKITLEPRNNVLVNNCGCDKNIKTREEVIEVRYGNL
jgi:hypothetical protein